MGKIEENSREQLREELRRYRSIKEICNRYGVSRATADRIRRENASMANDEASTAPRQKVGGK